MNGNLRCIARLAGAVTLIAGCETSTPLGACLFNCEQATVSEVITDNSAPITTTTSETLGAQSAELPQAGQ